MNSDYCDKTIGVASKSFCEYLNLMKIANRFTFDSVKANIEKEQKDKLFQLTGKESKGTKGEIGKGLGLFFCKEFVTMNKGDVYVDSAPQKGTKVTFSIPLYELEDNYRFTELVSINQYL